MKSFTVFKEGGRGMKKEILPVLLCLILVCVPGFAEEAGEGGVVDQVVAEVAFT